MPLSRHRRCRLRCCHVPKLVVFFGKNGVPMDSTHLHWSYTFCLVCRICTLFPIIFPFATLIAAGGGESNFLCLETNPEMGAEIEMNVPLVDYGGQRDETARGR